MLKIKTDEQVSVVILGVQNMSASLTKSWIRKQWMRFRFLRLNIGAPDKFSFICFRVDLESHKVQVGEKERDSLISLLVEMHDALDLSEKMSAA
jgi:hypothetical protein